MKIIDKSKSVYLLTQEQPELIALLYDLGFTEIKNPIVRKTVGKYMTLERGAKMKNIPWDTVVKGLHKAGYEIGMTRASISDEKVEELRDLLQRLHAGEDLALLRERFREQFHNVDVEEIMAAEKALMEGGVPAKEIQKLCDLHSALFQNQRAYSPSLTLPELDEAHPLKHFETELSAIEALLEKTNTLLGSTATDEESLQSLSAELAQIPIHYAKKGDLLYPLLHVKYGIIGPAKVMWAKDVELRQELHRALSRLKKGERSALTEELLSKLREMCQKERAFLLPLCAKQLSDEDWAQIDEDIRAYEPCLGVRQKAWHPQAVPEAEMKSFAAENERIDLGSGSLTREELIAILNAIPQELTFVDAKDTNRYFNEGPGLKHFKRPRQALGRDVYSCHPPQAEAAVRKMITAFKSGERDVFVREVKKGSIHLVVEYRAVRNAEGEYLGVLELLREEQAD